MSEKNPFTHEDTHLVELEFKNKIEEIDSVLINRFYYDEKLNFFLGISNDSIRKDFLDKLNESITKIVTSFPKYIFLFYPNDKEDFRFTSSGLLIFPPLEFNIFLWSSSSDDNRIASVDKIAKYENKIYLDLNARLLSEWKHKEIKDIIFRKPFWRKESFENMILHELGHVLHKESNKFLKYLSSEKFLGNSNKRGIIALYLLLLSRLKDEGNSSLFENEETFKVDTNDFKQFDEIISNLDKSFDKKVNDEEFINCILNEDYKELHDKMLEPKFEKLYSTGSVFHIIGKYMAYVICYAQANNINLNDLIEKNADIPAPSKEIRHYISERITNMNYAKFIILFELACKKLNLKNEYIPINKSKLNISLRRYWRYNKERAKKIFG
jgi:hypothetical protein